MFTPLFLPAAVMLSIGPKQDPGTEALTTLNKRIDELIQLVGEYAPKLNSESECLLAKQKFESLSRDLEAAIRTYSDRVWPKLLKARLGKIEDNLDLQFHASGTSSVDSTNFYLKALSACFSKSSTSSKDIWILEPSSETSFGIEELEKPFHFVSVDDLSRKFIITGSPVSVSILHPAYVEGNLIKVVIDHREFSLRGNEHVFAISCSSVAYFRLDTTINRFYLFKTKHSCI